MSHFYLKSAAYLSVFLSCYAVVSSCNALSAQNRVRDYNVELGIFQPGKYNAITDVPGVKVGHFTLNEGNDKRTGVTAIIPHQGNIFKKKVPAAIYIGNGFGKLAGYTQVKELGNIETPIVLTNTLNVAAGLDALITYTLNQPGNENVRSVNAVVGETNDGGLNDIRSRFIKPEMVLQALEDAKSGPVEEGSVGAGTGTQIFGFKGGIGTSSRVLPKSLGGYTVGVIVQSNYGGVLQIGGIPVGEMLGKYSFKSALEKADGSCMMVVITDAPVDARNLERIAKRAMLGLARTGGIASNGSGDYVIALSVNEHNLIDENTRTYNPVLLHNDDMSALFLATIEATAEALWNSMFAAEDSVGYNGRPVKALPKEKMTEIFGLKK